MNSDNLFSKKFTLNQILEKFYKDVEYINDKNLSPNELKLKKKYLSAILILKNANIVDVVRYALSFGRIKQGKAQEFSEALPIIAGWNINHPNSFEIEYSKILYIYSINFKKNRKNLKDLILGFTLNSSLSPVKSFFDKQLDFVIQNSKRNAE